ncbi:hypothetical protein GCM10028862_17430 [Luteimonas pelagia]
MDDPDFSLLYADLGLPPDCSLEEFKRAYRRRVARLHPDRNGGATASPDSQAALRSLFAAHAAVNRFHRRHGRMPGGIVGRDGVPGGSRVPPRSHLPAVTAAGNPVRRAARSTLGLAIVFVVLLVLLASRGWLDVMPG